MATDHLTVRSPLQRRELWDFLPFRALLLGTTDQSSVLSLLPEGHSLLNVILGFVVLHYEGEVPAMVLCACSVLAKSTMYAGQRDRSAQGGRARHPYEVADVLVVCFAPGRVNEPKAWVRCCFQTCKVQ